MWFSSLMRNAKPSGLAQRRRMPAVPRQRSTFRPQLEALEDRWMPSILTVTNNLDARFGGPLGSLRYEIGQAQSGDTIVFAPSLDGQTITLSGSELDIASKNAKSKSQAMSLTIQGPGAGLLTINGGSSAFSTGTRVFAVEKNTKVTLSGLTITGGGGIAYAGLSFASPNDNEGGGILNLGTLTVSSCTVSGNYASPQTPSNSYGGGIYNAGTLTVTGSTISGNSATWVANIGVSEPPTNDGGGIYNAGTLTVTGSTVSSNLAFTDGGGIYNAGTATVSGCTLSGNYAYGQGGAIYNAGTMTVSSCTVSANFGDGIFNANGASMTVSNSVFSKNFLYNIFGSYTDGGGNTFS